MANINEILAKYSDEAVDVTDTEEEVEEETTPDEEESTEEDPKEEKMIPQSKVDQIVQDRLKREKAKYLDHEEIVQALIEWGYEGSVADIKKQVKEAVDLKKKQEQLESLQEEAEEMGASPKLLEKIAKLEKVVEDMESEKKAREEAERKALEEKEAREKEEQAQKEAFAGMVQEFNKKYPDIQIEALASNVEFMDFINDLNPNLSLLQMYEKYIKTVGKAQEEALKKYQSRADRSTNSGKLKSDGGGGYYGLTPNQQKLARENGMTYKEYAERFSRIKR